MLLKKIARKGKHVTLRAGGLAKRVVTALELFLRGLLFIADYRESNSRQILRVPYRVFGNGLKSSVKTLRAKFWIALVPKRVTIVLFGNLVTTPSELSDWIRRIHRFTGALFILDECLSSQLDLNKHRYKFIRQIDSVSTDFASLRKQILKDGARDDVWFCDVSQPFLAPIALHFLKYALYKFQGNKKLSVVFPLLSTPDGPLSGWDLDRKTESWQSNDKSVNAIDQLSIPRYVLASPVHGALISRDFLEATPASVSETSFHDDIDTSFVRWLQTGLSSQARALVYAPVVAEIRKTPTLHFDTIQTNGFLHRSVRNADGKIRIIFVLPATTISGGIRAVFEMATGLSERDYAVEIWSIQGQPSWTTVPITVQHFRRYEALLAALSGENAIKVATWWETAQVVWLASVRTGLPVQYVQEFETWFYPTDETAKSAVAACYRREFRYLTTGTFTQNELTQVGISAEKIPVAYDSEIFYPRESVTRDETTMLALGRSFFQKNFAFTAAAWRSLKEKRPPLVLFGQEPNILVDSRVQYHVKPSDDEVAELYSGSGVFVQTSLHEGFCLPVLEAMACGCPVITTDSHGNRDFCVDGENCLVVEQNNVDELAKTIERVLSDQALREKLRTGGLTTAQNYRWSVIVPTLGDFFSQLAEQVEHQ